MRAKTWTDKISKAVSNAAVQEYMLYCSTSIEPSRDQVGSFVPCNTVPDTILSRGLCSHLCELRHLDRHLRPWELSWSDLEKCRGQMPIMTLLKVSAWCMFSCGVGACVERGWVYGAWWVYRAKKTIHPWSTSFTPMKHEFRHVPISGQGQRTWESTK
jgi:hypothetical protein